MYGLGMNGENDTEHEEEREMSDDEESDSMIAFTDTSEGKSWREVLGKGPGNHPTAPAPTVTATRKPFRA